MIEYQDLWREVWTDGRALPTDVGGSGKDALDPRYNGYSVGHWEDDYTFVVDTTGLDDRSWATKAGILTASMPTCRNASLACITND